jgi:hypothetical protein
MHDWTDIKKFVGQKPYRIQRMYLPEDDVVIDGDFEASPLSLLDNDAQIFIAEFVKSHGSIKAMEKRFGLSYPTIKGRLQGIVDALSQVRMPEMQEVAPEKQGASTEESTRDEAPTVVTATDVLVRKRKPRWLRIVVQDGDEARVNIKIPLMLLKAGVKLKSFLPDSMKVKGEVHGAKAKGMNPNFEFLLSDIDPKNVDAFIESLMDDAIEIDGSKGEKIRIFCE